MRFSVCNASLKELPAPAVFDRIAEIGYDGVEISPRTLGPSLETIEESHVFACRRSVESAGLEVVGVHGIFGRDTRYDILRQEPVTRETTLNAMIRVVEICGGLGGSVLVFGSPWQRNLPKGMSHAEAMDVAAGLVGHVKLLAALETAGVTFCFEPLSEDQTDFVNRARDAVELVQRIDHPNVGTMLDGYSITWEEDEIDTIIRTCGHRLRHFHADDETKRGPGQGELDYRAVAASLEAIGYEGWMSIETHDHETDLQPLAEGWLKYLQSCWDKIG